MAKTKGSSIAEVSLRREQIWHLALKGFSAREITKGMQKQGIDVSKRTVERDLHAIRLDLLASARASELYSVKTAFAELTELWRESWQQYARPQVEIPTKDDGTIKIDDRLTKATILRDQKAIVVERARLCGFYSPKVMEHITMFENARVFHMRVRFIEERGSQIVIASVTKSISMRQGSSDEDEPDRG